MNRKIVSTRPSFWPQFHYARVRAKAAIINWINNHPTAFLSGIAGGLYAYSLYSLTLPIV